MHGILRSLSEATSVSGDAMSVVSRVSFSCSEDDAFSNTDTLIGSVSSCEKANPRCSSMPPTVTAPASPLPRRRAVSFDEAQLASHADMPGHSKLGYQMGFVSPQREKGEWTVFKRPNARILGLGFSNSGRRHGAGRSRQRQTYKPRAPKMSATQLDSRTDDGKGANRFKDRVKYLNDNIIGAKPKLPITPSSPRKLIRKPSTSSTASEGSRASSPRPLPLPSLLALNPGVRVPSKRPGFPTGIPPQRNSVPPTLAWPAPAPASMSSVNAPAGPFMTKSALRIKNSNTGQRRSQPYPTRKTASISVAMVKSQVPVNVPAPTVRVRTVRFQCDTRDAGSAVRGRMTGQMRAIRCV
ncbi:hypothetical protein HMN09_00348700 [Mycena chlorophos]|uniref:Uncharacterized protein n=1 Tax=Mycena chlorophos TaxID=658473 RepID=A0A8H6TGE4_MYCCL|nr:hypothetical protein HMN09_00348700 [Mycena chlorophos]